MDFTNTTGEFIFVAINSIPLSFVWIAILITFTIIAVITMMLTYHWKEFGGDFYSIKKGRAMYFSGTIILCLLVLIAGIMFTFSV